MIKLKLNDEVIIINDDLETDSENKLVLNVLKYVGSLTPDNGFPELNAVNILESCGAEILVYPEIKDADKIY